jgi:hypothetical protein
MNFSTISFILLYLKDNFYYLHLMKYNFYYSAAHDAYHFGMENNGIGVFKDEKDGRCKDGACWFANIVFFDHDIWGIGPYNTMEEAQAASILYYEGRVNDYGADYGIKLSEYLGFALELGNFLDENPKMKVFGALTHAVTKMKKGQRAIGLIQGDLDKYRDGFGEWEEPCKKLREILVRYNVIHENGRIVF